MQSYAQFDTDLNILSLFPDGHVGNYIDIGASHPVTMSNTYLLYKHGWTGICVEPTDKARFFKEYRKKDIILQMAVGQHDGTATFHECSEDTLSSVLLTEAEKRGEYKTRDVEIKTLASILYSLHIAPDWPFELLSIDVEGYEKEVLEGCPFESGFRPKIIVIEACEPCTTVPSWSKWEHILHSFNYVHFKTTGVNRFYSNFS